MGSQTHVSHMDEGDLIPRREKLMTLDRARNVKMELITKSGETIVLKSKVALQDRRNHRLNVHEQESALRFLL